MTLDECIAYLQNVSSERKPRSRKARQVLQYLMELKRCRKFIDDVCEKNDTIRKCVACDMYKYGICIYKEVARDCRERGEDGRE